jgi:hypothetical protein
MLDITAPDLADPATVTAQYRLAPLPRILSRDATLSWTDTLQDLANSEAPTGPWRVTSDDIARTHSILNAAELRLSYLLSLPEGWDSYGAQPVQRDLAERALDVIRLLLEARVPEPSIVPTPMGGIQLEWHVNDMDFEVTVESQFALEFYFHHGDREDVEGVLTQDLGPALPFLDQIRAAAAAAA